MRTTDEHIEWSGREFVKRISWAAIFAGLAVALAIEVLLGFLGLAIGATAVNPLTQQEPIRNLGIGAGIWLFISMILALFAGGWVAGRVAGFPGRTESALHGVVTWAAALIVTVYLTGAAVGGAFSLAGKGIAAAAPQIKEAAGAAMQQAGGNWDAINREATTLVQQRAKDPQAVQAATTQLHAGMQKLFVGEPTEADRENVIGILVQNTTMSRDEAAQTVAGWERNYQQLQTQGEQKAREVGQTAATGVAGTAWALFAIALLSAIGAAWGGWLGTPRVYEERAVA